MWIVYLHPILRFLLLGSLATAPNPGGAAPSAPKGTVAFFNLAACPVGWNPARYAAGRLVLATSVGSSTPVQVGTALGGQEDRRHKHEYATTVSVGSRSIAAASSCCNDSATKAGSYAVSGTTEEATSGLPFVQLVVCEKE